MFNWLKKHFIPHEGNDHQPHFLRTKNIRYLVAIVFLLELGVLVVPFVPAFDPANNSYLASVLPAVLDDLTNQNRQSQHLAVLTVNPVVSEKTLTFQLRNPYNLILDLDNKTLLQRWEDAW